MATAKQNESTSTEDKAADETAKGYVGADTDPTPNESYTVGGVTSDKPTPETDAKAAEAARGAHS